LFSRLCQPKVYSFSPYCRKGIYALWATSAVIGGVWLTDWKVILGYVPWINGKFKEDE
uniref:Cytochrome b-c1 complex subunit 10 n=1 Tax=Naja naja TaxID=35670 RepID=A0A8C6V3W5_NAJNA